MISLRRVLRCSVSLRHYATATTTATATRISKSTRWQKPTEVPFQPKLVNSVNLIGTVNKPLQFETSPDGTPIAATVLTRHGEKQKTSSLLIPLVFQGDLAHTAIFHLKQNDVIHVHGELSTDSSHSKSKFQIQITVQSLNFVEDFPHLKNGSTQKLVSSSEGEDDKIKPGKEIHSEKSGEHSKLKSWKDVVNKTSKSEDVQSTKESTKVAAFESKIESGLQPELKQSITTAKKYPESLSSAFGELLKDPKQWWDYRYSKRNELVKPNYPDFKHKDGNTAIWIDKAPQWVLSRLKELEFDIPPVKSKQAKDSKGAESWNDLLQNPAKWLDNRLNKVKPNHPDFKRKDGNAAIWIDTAPQWVLTRLKELEFDIPVVKSKQAKDSEGSESWNDLLQNPAKWWDNRLNKRNVRAPDFKHKDTGKGLWLIDSPSWVLPKLPTLKPNQQSAETSEKKTPVSS